MSQAVIVPFPGTTNSRTKRGGEQERLRRALEDLQAALGEQKRALSGWRFAMTELGIGVAGLGQALGSYQDSLGDVEARLTGLCGEARTMQRWAAEATAQARLPAATGAAPHAG